MVANSEGVPTSGITGSQATSATATYTWIATSGSGTWTTAANWSPTRTTPDVTDQLQFTNGGTPTATAVPTQTIGRLTISGNTAVVLQGSTTTFMITGDGTPTNELSIANGSSILANGTSSLTFAFSGVAQANVAGTLEFNNTSVTNTLNLTNCTMTVTSVGKLAAGTTSSTSPWTGVTATTLQMDGTYEHKYTTTSGTIPTATWNSGSTCLVSGYTTNTTSPSGVVQTFSNFTWQCAGQTGNLSLGGTVPLAVNGTFTVANTNLGSLRLAGASSPTLPVNNFTQTGGVLELNSGAGSTVLQVSGTFNQSAGVLQSSANGAGTPRIEFNGTSGTQSVNFFNFAPQGGATTYRVINPNGINLTGTGTLTTSFNINNSAGVRISTTASPAISTALNLVYGTTTTLTYDAAGSLNIGAAAFPAANGPVNLVLNVGTGNTATLPFARAISGVFTLTSGKLNTSGLLTLNNTAVGAVSGGSATAHVNGPLARTLPASLVSGSTYVFPIGKGTNNFFELVNPTTNAGGTVVVQAEVFDANSGGTAGANMGALNTDRFWAASITSAIGNFTNSNLRLRDPSVTSLSAIAASTTQGGSYDLQGGTSPTIVAGTSVTTIAPAVTALPGFLVIGTKAISMSYVSSTTTQSVVTPVFVNTTNNQVIGL
ncbi:MAG: hypothetical protein IPN44_05445 [Flavobacteriales bacterium]|nr:hypothetical protein [Flavobacteriales bacterium]